MDEQVLRSILKFAGKLRRSPRNKVYAPLGEGYRTVGLLEDGIDTCLAGLELFPKYLTCHEVLGKIYLRQNRLEEARSRLEKVHEVIGDNLQLCKSLVRVYARGGEGEKAEQLLEWIVKKDPFDFEMKNIRTQIRQNQEVTTLRQEAVARGEDPDEVDIYKLAEREVVVDIKSIIGGQEEVDYDHEAHQRATDDALDSIEDFEGQIDVVADAIVKDAEAEPQTAAKKSRRTKKDIELRREIIDQSVEELSAATQIAQIELELSLLDEASLLCNRLLKDDPEDIDLKNLTGKFDRHIEVKENQLEKLEAQDLAHGL